jgi:UDP-N-acetylglucosamine 3-dehydrogenase
MGDLRAGLVGYGQMGRHHARVLEALTGVELVGISDPRVSSDQDGRFVEGVEALIRRGLDMAVLAVPTAIHEPLAVTLAGAGVHTLVEKPVAADPAAAQRMAKAFDDAGVIGCVGHIERYNPALQEMRRRLATGELGEVFQVTTRRQGPFPARVEDVGVVLDLASHDIDLTAWVTQQTYSDLSARTAHRSGRLREDLVAAVGRLQDGTVVNHLVNWLSPMKERVTVVLGERGCFIADTVAADLTFHANGVAPVEWDSMASFRGVVQGDMTRYAIAKPEPLAVELSAFRDAVRGTSDDIVPIREAALVVEVAEAMLRSSVSAQTQSLGP